MKKRRLCSIIPALCFSVAAFAQFENTVALNPSKSGTYYVDAIVGEGIHERFLVDTGSSLLTMNKQLFEKLKREGDMTKNGYIGLRLATGKIKRAALYHIKQFSLGEGCQLGEVDVAYIPNGNNILGLSLLSRVAPFALSTSPPQLLLSNCEKTLLTANK